MSKARFKVRIWYFIHMGAAQGLYYLWRYKILCRLEYFCIFGFSVRTAYLAYESTQSTGTKLSGCLAVRMRLGLKSSLKFYLQKRMQVLDLINWFTCLQGMISILECSGMFQELTMLLKQVTLHFILTHEEENPAESICLGQCLSSEKCYEMRHLPLRVRG